MATIKMKRGLDTAIKGTVLAMGEFGIATDTGNVYVGIETGNYWVNPPAATADEAAKLTTGRRFSIGGDGTAETVSFDGTADVALALHLAAIDGLAPGAYTKLTVDAKGRVIKGASLAAGDLPEVAASKVTGLGTAALRDTGTGAGKVVVVGEDGKLPEGILPALAVCDTFVAEGEAAMLALTAQTGDVCIRSDQGKSYILSALPASAAENWKWLKTPDCKIVSVNGQTGAVTLVAEDVHIPRASKSSGLYKVTVDALGHVTAAVAAVKDDITALGIPAQDTVFTLPAASPTVLGGVKVGAGLAVSDGVLSVGDIDGGTF